MYDLLWPEVHSAGMASTSSHYSSVGQSSHVPWWAAPDIDETTSNTFLHHLQLAPGCRVVDLGACFCATAALLYSCGARPSWPIRFCAWSRARACWTGLLGWRASPPSARPERSGPPGASRGTPTGSTSRAPSTTSTGRSWGTPSLASGPPRPFHSLQAPAGRLRPPGH